MKVKIVYSTKTKVEDIVSDLKNQLSGFDYSLLQLYASSNIPVQELNAQLYKELGNTPMFGCTTSGEIVSGKMLDNSVVLMAISADITSDFQIEVLENLSTKDSCLEGSFASFKQHFGEDLSTLNPREHLGFVLIDGLSRKEECINERIGDLTNIFFVGASAGDDLKFKQTHVFANGKVYSDAAVLCLMKVNVKFDILKTQSFKTTDKILKVTKVNEETRTVNEFNGKPALEEYISQTACNQEDIQKAFFKNPVGLNLGDDFFVRSPQKVEGSDIVFYCSVKEGMQLDLLESRNIIEDTKKDLNAKLKDFGKVTALVNFNCILRTLELKAKEQTQAYGELFKDIPTIGFSSYGESYIGHINQTSVIVLFGE